MIRCKEVYFPNPGPREPYPSANFKRHWSGVHKDGVDSVWLILFDPAARMFHMRRKGPTKPGCEETFGGEVRSCDATHAEYTPWDVPAAVEALSMPALVREKATK